MKSERLLKTLIVIVVAGAALYFGYRLFDKWHNAKTDSAVERERRQWNLKAEELIGEIDMLQRQLEARQRSSIPDEKMKAVFGEKTTLTPSVEDIIDCKKLERQIIAFFEYLDEQDYVAAYQFDVKTLKLFQDMLVSASENIPVNIGETRDILTLMHNIAHLYRILGKKKSRFIKDILKNESDFIEPVLASFFAYFSKDKRCEDNIVGYPAFEAFYEYAGFFLNTIGGRSYLFRRNSNVRILLSYYCVIILDQANDNKLNSYGIDIRPHINSSFFDILNHNGLQYQEKYLAKLSGITKKYHR